MEIEFYHQSLNKKSIQLQNQMLNPTIKEYPLTSIIQMAIMSFENNIKD